MSNDEKLSTKDKLELAVESGLQLIPVVGGSLSTAYFGYKNEKRFKRLESFYEEYSRLVENNATATHFPPIQNHNNEELISIIETLNDKIEKEHTEQKRRLFMNYLNNTLINPVNGNYDKRKFFLTALAELTTVDCRVLSYIYKEQMIKKNHFVPARKLFELDEQEYFVVGTIGRIKNYGFLLSSDLSGPLVGGSPRNPLVDEVYNLSPLGIEFVEFCLE